MPPKPPPPPPDLTVMQCIAALGATWVTVALDQCLRGAIGAALGIPWRGMALVPSRAWLPVAVQDAGAPATVGGAALMVLAGAAVVPLLALALHAVVTVSRPGGWLRGFALAWLVVAFLWAPTALVASVAPAPAGPVAELYVRLGEPQAGRWAAFALGAVLLVIVAGPLAGAAVSVGRAWMRADALEFRRRLVRVVAGWPAVVAAAALLGVAGWARTPWMALWPAAVLVTLNFRTR